MRVVKIAGFILLLGSLVLNGCSSSKPADTPFPSEELEPMLENHGYRLDNLNIRKVPLGPPDYTIVVFPSIPPEDDEPDDTWGDTIDIYREYKLVGKGSAAKLIWLACQLVNIEYKEYPDTDNFIVFGYGTFGPYDIPVFAQIEWAPLAESRPYVIVSFDDMQDIQNSVYPYRSICMHEFLNKESVDPSDITEADTQSMVDEMVPSISHPYPDWIYSFSSESELVSWQWRPQSPQLTVLDVQYSSPVPLELTLVNPEGDVVDSRDIQGDLLGQSIETLSLWVFSPINGTYKLIVKPSTNLRIIYPDQVVEIIRTHDIPLN